MNIKMDSHKLLWHMDRVTPWKAGETIAPITVEISPTSKCNHRCVFCAYDYTAAKDYITAKTALYYYRLSLAIRDMAKVGVKAIVFAGDGEPLLYTNLPDIIRYAYSLGIDVALATNGCIDLSVEEWGRILPCLTWLRFSVDAGSAEVHSGVHRTKAEDWYTLLDNIQHCVNAKRSSGLDVTIGTQFVVIQQNYRDLPDYIRLFTSGGFKDLDYVSVKPYSWYPLSKQDEKDLVYMDSLTAIADIGSTIYAACRPGDIPDNVIFRREAAEAYLSRQHTFEHCLSLPFTGFLGSDGMFYSCPVGNDDNHAVGNIYNESFSDIIYGDRRRERIESVAATCMSKMNCRVNCRMARANEWLNGLVKEPAHVNFI